MGKKDKKRRRSRSRSASRDRNPETEKRKKHKKRYSSDDSSDSSDDSSSNRGRSSKHHKKSHNRSKDKKRRSRSRSRSKDRKKKKLTEEDIERMREEEKERKELLKAMENPEEKRARRLAKKEAKERKRKEQMGWDDEYAGYTNADNPFGDEHLLDTFVWGKKLEKTGIKNVTHTDLERMQKQKMIENKIELEKVKKRRLEREKEMEEREKEREKLQRDKESEYFREWEQQEDSFHLNQAKLRSKIRIEDGRAKPIDLLAKYISAEDDEMAIEMHEPYTYLNGLTIQDLEDLLEDIKVYMELDEARNHEFWQDITIVTEDELEKLRKIDPNNPAYVGERRSGINQSVIEDVHSVFKGKTQKQLIILGDTIRNKLTGGEGVDVGYWESLLGQLRAHMARTRLRERHQEELRRKLFKLKQEQGIDSQPLFPILIKEEASSRPGSPAVRSGSPAVRSGSPAVRSGSPAVRSGSSAVRSGSPAVRSGSSAVRSGSPAVRSGSSAVQTLSDAVQSALSEGRSGSPLVSTGDSRVEPQAGPSTSAEDGEEAKDPEGEGEDSVLTEKDLDQQCYEDYDAGSYSPRLVRMIDLEPDTIVYDPEDDMKRLEYARIQLFKIGKAKEETDVEFLKRAREGMGNDEAQFSVEVPIEKQAMLWSDKYRPRKPRFFNRVHTGFEWNKYNQTHYDIDNPPPKIVQGYKFNIFYPDLIEKTQTPEYTLTPCEDNKDFAVLRFKAGPPYEDIGFKIVNREWEYSYKRGFRCQFHNNIFQLWFHFKRYRYRR